MDTGSITVALWLGLLLAVVVVVAAVFTFVQATSARRSRQAAEAALERAQLARDQAVSIVDTLTGEPRPGHIERSHSVRMRGRARDSMLEN